MNTNLITRTLHTFGAQDPARERLRKVVYVTTGILCSVLWGYGVIHFLHADSGLLAMSMFLSLMSGLFVKDPTARDRVITTACLIPTVVLVPALATALHSHRPVLLSVFVLLSGVAVWIRRFGSRTTAIGTLAFFSFFFAMFMHLTPKELPAFLLIAGGAVGVQLIMKLIMWLQRHPERELGIMLRELRVAAAAALESATPAHTHSLQTRLQRVDTMWRAVTDWQKSFRTESFTNWDADTLAIRVMDACVHTEEACNRLADVHPDGHSGDSGRSSRERDHSTALTHTFVTLDEHSPTERLAAARQWATEVVSEFESHEGTDAGRADLCDYRLAECVLAHARLRQVGLHSRSDSLLRPGTDSGPQADPEPTVGSEPTVGPEPTVSPVVATSPDDPSSNTSPPRRRFRFPRPHWTPWRDWAPTSRLAIQAMTATAIASVVGEAISASRWYWAVLTAFLVFLSTTTRSGILTRAYRRILGTILGLIAGIALSFLAHDVTGVLVAICLLGVIGMIYFGPLNYLYASFCITIVLVAVYDLLGVLEGHLLVVRLEETVAGAVIGVLCAYLLLSTTSRPALLKTIDGYLDALDDLLRESSDLTSSPIDENAVLGKVHAVEAAQAEVDETISTMSTAILIVGRDRVETARNLMAQTSRSSVRFAQVVLTDAETGASELSEHHDVIQEAVTIARDAAERVRHQLDQPSAPAGTPTPSATPITTPSPTIGDPTVREALTALARFTWVMHRLNEVLAPSENRVLLRLRHTAL